MTLVDEFSESPLGSVPLLTNEYAAVPPVALHRGFIAG
jgi:hypothetical protein